MLGDFQDDRTDLASLDGDMDMDLEAALNQDEEVGSEEDEDEEVSLRAGGRNGWIGFMGLRSFSLLFFVLRFVGRRR
jgi:hypothetical protein